MTALIDTIKLQEMNNKMILMQLIEIGEKNLRDGKTVTHEDVFKELDKLIHRHKDTFK